MYIFLSIAITVIENLTNLGVMLYLTNVSFPKLTCSVRNFLLLIFSTVIMYFVQAYDNSYIHIGMVISISQYTIVTKLISHETLKNSIISVFFTYILQFVVQGPIVFIALLIDDFNLATSLDILIIIMIANLFFTVLIIHFFPIRRLYEKILRIPFFIVFTIIFMCAFFGIITLFFDEVYMPEYILTTAIFIFLILAFFFIIFFALRAQKKEQAIHYYETYLPILNDIILNIRMAQHNYNNTILAIASLPDIVSDYDELSEKLKQYGSQMIYDTIPTRFLHFENKLLSALLYNKYCFAKEKKINLEISIYNHFYNSKASEFEIVDLTGILLDNAIEASNQNDTIYVEIGFDGCNNENYCLNKYNDNAPLNTHLKNNTTPPTIFNYS